MKQTRFILPLLILCYTLLAGGCGAGDGSNVSSSDGAGSPNAVGTENFAADSQNSGAEADNTASGIGDETTDKTSAESDNKTTENTGVDTASNINTEMLVYTCNLSIDTLDFGQSVATFQTMLSAAGGFIESENYSDGRSSTSYYIEEYEKEKLYQATVRVPHDKYDDFLNGADQLGDVRSKTSNVQNVGQEYTDLNTSLQIYEAKEKRYINMLSTITDDEQAIRVEKELTDLQVKIASIKMRMNEIHEDVAYSTIEIQIREVTKYEEKKVPEKTDTFLQRLGNTLKDTWKYFLVFMEELLFFIIRIFPYALIIGVILFVILRHHGKRKRTNKPDQFPKPDLTESDLTELDLSEPDTDNTPEEHDNI